jgi:hypothetical protein
MNLPAASERAIKNHNKKASTEFKTAVGLIKIFEKSVPLFIPHPLQEC